MGLVSLIKQVPDCLVNLLSVGLAVLKFPREVRGSGVSQLTRIYTDITLESSEISIGASLLIATFQPSLSAAHFDQFFGEQKSITPTLYTDSLERSELIQGALELAVKKINKSIHAFSRCCRRFEYASFMKVL